MPCKWNIYQVSIWYSIDFLLGFVERNSKMRCCTNGSFILFIYLQRTSWSRSTAACGPKTSLWTVNAAWAWPHWRSSPTRKERMLFPSPSNLFLAQWFTQHNRHNSFPIFFLLVRPTHILLKSEKFSSTTANDINGTIANVFEEYRSRSKFLIGTRPTFGKIYILPSSSIYIYIHIDILNMMFTGVCILIYIPTWIWLLYRLFSVSTV